MYNSLALYPQNGYSPAFDGDIGGGISGLDQFGGTSTLDYGIFSNPGLGAYGGYNSKMWDMYNNMDPKQLLQYQTEMQKAQMLAGADLSKASRAIQFQADGVEILTQRQSQILHRLIKENRQDEVMESYNKLREAVKAQLKESGLTDAQIEKLPPEQLNTYVERAYYSSNGTQIMDDLERNGDSEFVHGLKKSVLGVFGLTNNTSVQENIAEISGVKEDKTDKAMGYIGAGVGIAATCLVGLGAFRYGIVKPIGNLISKCLGLIKK